MGMATGSVVLTLAATAGAAQTPSAVTASIEIVDSLTISTLQQMRFNDIGLRAAGGPTSSLADAPAVIQIGGGSGRAYRITLPISVKVGGDGAVVENLTAWSANAGDISVSRSSRMDADGRDTLRIGGSLRLNGDKSVGPITAAVFLGADYQ